MKGGGGGSPCENMSCWVAGSLGVSSRLKGRSVYLCSSIRTIMGNFLVPGAIRCYSLCLRSRVPALSAGVNGNTALIFWLWHEAACHRSGAIGHALVIWHFLHNMPWMCSPKMDAQAQHERGCPRGTRLPSIGSSLALISRASWVVLAGSA